MSDWIAALNRGDKVIIVEAGMARRERVAVVSSITPTGRVRVRVDGRDGERVFLKSGVEYGHGSKYHHPYIRQMRPGDEERVADELEAERLAANLGAMSWRDWQALSLETLRAVRDLLSAAGKGEKS